MRSAVFFILFSMLSWAAYAQDNEPQLSKKEKKKQRINELIRQEEEGVNAYSKHTALGIKLTSDGYGAFIEVGRAQSVKRSLLFQFEFAERKHQKEEKQQVSGFTTTTPIIYGKINFFYPVKLGVQEQILLGNKSNKNGVSVTANGGGGLIFGLLRPYKADVLKTSGIRDFVGVDDADSAYFYNEGFYGGPDFSIGWSGLKLTPGLYIKTSLRFDYARYNEMLNALEVGLMAEAYSRKIPQMIYLPQKQVFLGAYVSLIFGRRK